MRFNNKDGKRQIILDIFSLKPKKKKLNL